ncbi:MAG: CPBP family intramembrane metalloprotease [Mogibacterium sp.]|nr:CPBP family intramembrane metalloprotease [Mogibacterium sp.]
MSNSATTGYGKISLITFFAWVIILSLIAEVCIVTGGPDWMYFVLMWIPAFSAIVASAFSLKENKEKFSLKSFLFRLWIRKCRIHYILLAVLIPLIYLLIPYMIYWKTHPDNFGYTGVAFPVVLKDCLPMMVVGILPNVISAMGEEIGWRGYMLPALTERSNHIKALIATGLFWACWHLPLLAFGDYMAGAPVWYKLPAFVLCILPVGIIIGGLTYMSNSVWPAAFLHAAHNNFDQAVFGVITRGDDMMYYVSETGFLTIICAWVIAIIMIVKIKDIETCGDCGEMSTCEKLEMITGNNEEALKRLKG